MAFHDGQLINSRQWLVIFNINTDQFDRRSKFRFKRTMSSEMSSFPDQLKRMHKYVIICDTNFYPKSNESGL